eukprot:256523-Chlamydomonas_euryale.AAC.2
MRDVQIGPFVWRWNAGRGEQTFGVEGVNPWSSAGSAANPGVEAPSHLHDTLDCSVHCALN